MNSIFHEFLEKGYKYNYHNGPNIFISENHALRDGVNCIGLIHLLIKRIFGITLPPNLRILEIYSENPYFETVETLSKLKLGDILFLGREQLPDYIKLYTPRFNAQKKLVNENEGGKTIGNKHAGYHTVMYIGRKDENGDYQVIDIEKETNTVCVWSLKKLMTNEKYAVLYRIKRLIVDSI